MPVFLRTLKINGLFLAKGVVVICLLVYIFNFVSSRLADRNIEALSWSVANKVIVVDPGHGGKDPGVVENGAVEKEITMETARKLAAILGHAGAVVLLTREGDTELTNPGGRSFSTWKREDLKARIEMANRRGADIFISIHVNSFRAGPREHGAQTFYQPGSEEGKQLAEAIQSEMVRILGNNHRRAKQVDYYILRYAKMPAVIVEVGFVTNPREGRLLQEPEYQSKVAYAIYAGVVKYCSEMPASKTKAKDSDIEAKEVFSTPPAPISAP